MQRVAVGAGRLVNQICLLTLLLLAACGSPGSELPLLPDVGPPDYSLAPGDQVRIITYGEENLTGEFRVNDSGNISLPLIGTVHAAGLTSSGLEGAVAAALRHGDLARNSHTGEGWSTAWGANRRGMARTDKRVSVARVGSRMSNTASPAALMGCILTVRCLVRVRWQHVAIAHERGRIRSARDRRMTSLP